MVLQFQPPQDLINAYLSRKSPGQELSEGVNQTLQTYAQLRASEQQQALAQQTRDLLSRKEEREGRQQFYDYGDTGSLPPDVRASIGQPAQGPPTESGMQPQVPSLIDRYNQFLQANPEGIKGREKKQANRPQQAPFLIGGKPAIFSPEKSQYEIAQVVDPTQPQAPVIPNPTIDPRVEPTPHAIGTQDGQIVLLDRKGRTSQTPLPAGGPLMSTTQTEGQANATLYASRMEEADKQLNDISSRVDLTSASAGAKGMAPNFLKGADIQQFEQSKRNFINAVLRRESGAAIAPSEFESGNKQYFPIFGDSKEVLKQKAMNRATAIAGLRNAAGQRVVSGQTPASVPAIKSLIKPGEEAEYEAYKRSIAGGQ